MPDSSIRDVLQTLRGNPFTTSLVVDGVVINNQKVVAVTNTLVYTVDAAGVVRATLLNQIDSVDF